MDDALKEAFSEKEKIFSEGIAKHKLVLVDEVLELDKKNRETKLQG